MIREAEDLMQGALFQVLKKMKPEVVLEIYLLLNGVLLMQN